MMAHYHYKIVQHDGGWAYMLNGTFSETFRSHDAALAAARRVVREQHTPGETTTIAYQDANGTWREERSEGGDRPEVDVQD
ncbi:MAG TPA: DUF2188 domain-containing protein [Rhodopila sp.]|uniref:DUF2188 domain-containing protein n=1 Tax=Rhodopila sp. TaxID=2480087 RepID=UPI002C72C757|nr:DUF2188 domain-containing protein [Rhodopila sp.]HVY14211.1 DUF2188 domain-containing protein [Rhodopila sp.]